MNCTFKGYVGDRFQGQDVGLLKHGPGNPKHGCARPHSQYGLTTSTASGGLIGQFLHHLPARERDRDVREAALCCRGAF